MNQNKNSKTLHGMSGTPCYCVWSGMVARCHNENTQFYSEYGGRGITVCDRWRESEGKGFLNFLEDMGERSSPKHWLDRKDSNRGYDKENCRWLLGSENKFNSRKQKNNSSGRTGVHRQRDKWRAKIYHNNKEISLGVYDSFELAVEAREEAELLYYGHTKE